MVRHFTRKNFGGDFLPMSKPDKKITHSKEYERLKENLKNRFISSAHILFGRDLKDLPMNDIYKTVAAVAKQIISENWIQTNKAYMERQVKQVYYFSIEFLMGRLLKANLINLGIDEAFREVMEDLDLNLDDAIDEEFDVGLGNGGLGRLAACFIDSMAAHRLPGHGCCIRYQYGLFEQKIIQGNQVEIPDNWLRDGFAWEYRKPDKSINVKFNGNAYMKKQPDGSLKLVHENAMVVMAVPYDVPIVGYHNKTVNTLRLWNAVCSLMNRCAKSKIIATSSNLLPNTFTRTIPLTRVNVCALFKNTSSFPQASNLSFAITLKPV